MGVLLALQYVHQLCLDAIAKVFGFRRELATCYFRLSKQKIEEEKLLPWKVA